MNPTQIALMLAGLTLLGVIILNLEYEARFEKLEERLKLVEQWALPEPPAPSGD